MPKTPAQSGWHPDWLRPVWPVPATVGAVFTTRAGGVSASPYSSLNLGSHVGDLQSQVEGNRAVVRQAIGLTPLYLNQVHGADIYRLGKLAPPPATSQATPQAISLAPTADGAYADQPAQVCTVMVADCLPVLLCDVHGTAVAAAHAGWRGLAGGGGRGGRGVLEAAVEAFSPLAPVYAARAAPELIAWLGPCIGPLAFEVGPEVRHAFVQQDADADTCFTPHGAHKWLCDLAGLARQRLARAGVRAVFGNDGSAPWCTVSNPSRFFSFRRDGITGRMAACIWLH